MHVEYGVVMFEDENSTIPSPFRGRLGDRSFAIAVANSLPSRWSVAWSTYVTWRQRVGALHIR